MSKSNKKLKDAVASGKAEAAHRKAVEKKREAEKRKKEGRAYAEKVTKNKAWLLKNDRIYKLVEEAVAREESCLVIDGDKAMADAVNQIEGFTAYTSLKDYIDSVKDRIWPDKVTVSWNLKHGC